MQINALLPKAELHCHLRGAISPAMLRAIRQDDPTYPIDPDQLATVYPIHDIESFFAWWPHVMAIHEQIDYLKPVAQHTIAQLKADGVRYAEWMISSGDMPPDNQAAVDSLADFREYVNQCEAGVIQVEFLFAFGRNRYKDDTDALEVRIMALWEAGLIVGVSLAGPEIGNPVKPFERSFARFHEAGLGIEIHAGEWVGAESVWDALQHGYPDRIGHGVTLFDDPRLIEIFQERQIHIEMCPTSNLKTGSVARIEDHPIRRAYDLGLNFGINTDDPGVFECSMASEYALVTEIFGFDAAAWETVYRNSIEARFEETLRVEVR